MRSRRERLLLCLCLSGSTAACGGAVPLLHPAHTLEQSQVTFGSGVSDQFAVGKAARVIDDGKATATGGGVDVENEHAFIEGSLVDHALGPGLSPWVGARVGLGHDNEAGLIYTGRNVRVDARHAFQDRKTALSIGLGLTALPPQTNDSNSSSGTALGGQRIQANSYDFSATGWGFDVPVLWGVRSRGHLFEFWSGARFGYERLFGDVDLIGDASSGSSSNPSPISSASTQRVANASEGRFYAEALVGLSVGVPPVFVRMELGGGVHRLTGALDFPEDAGNPPRRTFELTAASLSSAGALVFEF